MQQKKELFVINTLGNNTNSAPELTRELLIFPNGKTIGIISLVMQGIVLLVMQMLLKWKHLLMILNISEEVFERHHAKKCTWDEMISSADVISLHVPKTEKKTGIIGPDEFSKMKFGKVIWNKARGRVIQEKSQLKKLRSGKFAVVKIDTWKVLPPKENSFWNLSQVAMSPNVGASTTEAQKRIAGSIAIQVPRGLRGELVDYLVNYDQCTGLDSDPVSSYASLVEKLGVFSRYVVFNPTHLEINYRGKLARHEGTLVRLCFLKRLLQSRHHYVNYVNANQQVENAGFNIEENMIRVLLITKVLSSAFFPYQASSFPQEVLF